MQSRVLRWERSFSQDVLRLAIPIVIQSTIMAMMFIVDNLMIGQLGEIELVGVTQANRITYFFQVSSFGIMSGSSIYMAQYWGTKDIAGVQRTLGMGMILSLILSFLFAVPAIFCPEVLMRLFLHDPQTLKAGCDYLRVIGFTYFIQSISYLQNSALRSTENVRLPMWGSLAGIIVNVFFNYLLIFGHFGFPRLGVTGAAIATFMGCIAELAIILTVSYRNRLPNAATLRALFPRSMLRVKQFCRVVLPIMMNEVFWSLGIVIYSVAYGLMGTSTVASISILNNVEQLASVMLRGSTHACAVLCGMAIGAKRNDDAELTAKRMLVAAMGLGIVMGIVVFLTRGFMVGLFNVSPQTAETAKKLITSYASFMWIQSAACMLIVGILRAGGDVRFSVLMDVLPVWFIGIPLVFLFGPRLGFPIYTVYLIVRAEEIIKVIVCSLRLKSNKWIHNVVEQKSKLI